MRGLVCGGRDFSDTASAYKVLDAMHRAVGIDVLIEGHARLIEFGGDDGN